MEGLDFDVCGISELSAIERHDTRYVQTLDRMLDDVSVYEERLSAIRNEYDEIAKERFMKALDKVDGVTISVDESFVTSLTGLISSSFLPGTTIQAYKIVYSSKPTIELQRQVEDINERLQREASNDVEKINDKAKSVYRLGEDLNRAMYDLSKVVTLTEMPEFEDGDKLKTFVDSLKTLCVYLVNPNGAYESKSNIRSDKNLDEVEESEFTPAQLTDDNWVNVFKKSLPGVADSGNLVYLVRNPSRHSEPEELLGEAMKNMIVDLKERYCVVCQNYVDEKCSKDEC
ncbi:hypothetical protein GOV12_00715 [Candidatus Pacearchaeota archaeon]|nr:hypothetical protein [Candidatus Pacearchaeota archaeon]